MFPGEHDAVARRPHQRPVAKRAVEFAARARNCRPDCVSGSGLGVADQDGPRLAGAVRREIDLALARRDADERQALAVRRPFRRHVGVKARRHPGDTVSLQIQHADDATAGAGADEGQPGAVRRPNERTVFATVMHALRGGAALHRGRPDLATGQERDRVVLGRDCGCVAGAEAALLPALRIDQPHRLLRRAGRQAERVHVRTAFKTAAARIDDGAAGGRPGQVAGIHPVIALRVGDGVGGEAAVRARRREPDVARAARVEDPGGAAAGGRGGKAAGERRAEDLRQGKICPRRGGPGAGCHGEHSGNKQRRAAGRTQGLKGHRSGS